MRETKFRRNITGGGTVEPEQIYDHLQAACKLLENGNDHAIAAMVSHCMAMVNERYGVGSDHLDGSDNP